MQALANEIWGDLDGVQPNRHFLGKGLVTWGLPLEQVVALVTPQMVSPITGVLPPEFVDSSLSLPKDAEFAAPLDSNIAWIHRRTPDADYYVVANRTDRVQNIQSRFRVDGKEAEIWHPDTGVIEPAAYSIENGRTTVPLRLDQRESVFVAFRKPAASPSRVWPAVTSTTLATIDGPWRVNFEPNLGAPQGIELPKLEPLTANKDIGIKYFSGTATYTQTIDAPQSWFAPGAKIMLDLGSVGDLAEVSINGNKLGTLWKPPYKIDVTGALHAGANQLQISVTDGWSDPYGEFCAAVAATPVFKLLGVNGLDVWIPTSGRGRDRPPRRG